MTKKNKEKEKKELKEEEVKDAVKKIVEEKHDAKVEKVEFYPIAKEDIETLNGDIKTDKVNMRNARELAMYMQKERLIEGGPDSLHRQINDFLKMDMESFQSLKRAVFKSKGLDPEYEEFKEGVADAMSFSLPVLPQSKPKKLVDEDKLSCYSSNAKGLVNTLLGYYRMKVKNRDSIIASLKEENKRLQERIASLGGSSEEYEDIIEDLIINRTLFSETEEEEVDVSSELEYLWPDSAGYKKPIFKFGRFKIDRYDSSSTSILEQERQNKRKRDERALNGVASSAFKRD
jgi:hypothetical protein